ncbi:MAG: ABC transporter ATP-binding protein [Clostridiales bacterium]|nr:ABC transporter ATP-binding protein [Clostridiales bacterium]
MILFDRITKQYGQHAALRDFSLHIEKGQIVGLLGPNGAGKSTAMNILTGCLSQDAGSVKVCGTDIHLDPRACKKRIGYLPENAPLHDEMTVESYLAFICRLRGMKEREIPAHIAALQERTGLFDVRGRVIGHLSRGYRQRTGLAQALCADPDIIVLDEPTQGLDPAQAREFRTLISSLGKTHTVLFSSHILSDIDKICDRAVILHEGRIMADRMLKSETQKQLDVLISGSEKQLLPALSSLPSCLRVEALPHEKGQTRVKLCCPQDAPIERELFSLLRALDTPILRLNPAKDSLEDLYLSITGR